jgi:hypothetical protein
MRARRFHAHTEPSRTDQSLQVPRRPASTTANIARLVPLAARPHVGEMVEVSGAHLAPPAGAALGEPHHVRDLLHERTEQAGEPAPFTSQLTARRWRRSCGTLRRTVLPWNLSALAT